MTSVLVICAHSDDQIFGPGGTLAKYAKAGAEVSTIVVSFGESSHPHFKPREIRKVRISESVKADKIIGGKKVMFLGWKEFGIGEDRKEEKEKLVSLIRLTKPDMIFTHTGDDPHPDHRAVHRLVLDLYDELGLKGRVYTFAVWTILASNRRKPKLVVDISGTFNKKVQALHCFRSQINVLTYVLFNNLLYLSVYVRAFLNGLAHDCKFAEVFTIER